MPIFDNAAIGSRLVEIRKEQGFHSSAEFAKALQFNASFLSKIERGVKPIPETFLEQLQQQYGVNPAWLLFKVGDRYVPTGTKKKYGTRPDLTKQKELQEIKKSLHKLAESIARLAGLDSEQSLELLQPPVGTPASPQLDEAIAKGQSSAFPWANLDVDKKSRKGGKTR